MFAAIGDYINAISLQLCTTTQRICRCITCVKLWLCQIIILTYELPIFFTTNWLNAHNHVWNGFQVILDTCWVTFRREKHCMKYVIERLSSERITLVQCIKWTRHQHGDIRYFALRMVQFIFIFRMHILAFYPFIYINIQMEIVIYCSSFICKRSSK